MPINGYDIHCIVIGCNIIVGVVCAAGLLQVSSVCSYLNYCNSSSLNNAPYPDLLCRTRLAAITLDTGKWLPGFDSDTTEQGAKSRV